MSLPGPIEPPRPRTVLWSLFLPACVALLGCNNSRPASNTITTRQADPTNEMVESVRDTLRKPSDLAACRHLVEQLNVYLSRSGITKKPDAATPAERELWEKGLALRPEEVSEVARLEFTQLDAHFLNESILFRDTARALDIGPLPPAERASAALAWVVRNFRDIPPSGPAIPPGYAALRGTGTTLERTYAFLALLRQLGLDACLVGDAGAADTPDKLWAVGILVDGQVYLYDVRLGLPLPSPNGQGIATLEQVRTDAAPFKALESDPALPYDVTAERAKQAQLFVSASLTSASPRMRFLQGLVPDGTIRLADDLAAMRDRFHQAASGAEVRLWDPPVPDALPRLLFTFLPPNEGGGDDPRAGNRRLEKYHVGAIPWNRLPPFLLALGGEPGNRIKAQFASRMTQLSQPGQARDMIHRGQFDVATEQLVALRSQLGKLLPSSQRELDENSVRWAKDVVTVYADLARAERDVEKGDASAIVTRDAAREKVDYIWKNSQAPMLYIDLIASEPLMAEATFLLGLCKHEQAERQHQGRGAKDPMAWQAALTWWRQFVSYYPRHPWESAAKRNLAFALEGAGFTAEARAMFAALETTDLSPSEKLACKYWGSRLK